MHTFIYYWKLFFSAASADEKLLFKELFATYEPGIRPRLNSTDTIIVTLNLELNQLKEIVRCPVYILTLTMFTLQHSPINNNLFEIIQIYFRIGNDRLCFLFFSLSKLLVVYIIDFIALF